MTDTTDIKALRDVKRYGTKATGNEHFKYVTDEMTYGPWVKQEDYFALLTLLEAERQRAAGSEEELHKALHREKAAERKLLAAQEDIAALKAKLEIIHVLLDVKNELEKTFLKK